MSLVSIWSTDSHKSGLLDRSHGPVGCLACPARFERATYALEEFVAAEIFNYLNHLQLRKDNIVYYSGNHVTTFSRWIANQAFNSPLSIIGIMRQFIIKIVPSFL